MRHLILPLLLATTLPSAARLGETRAQCDTRYGKPVATTPRYGNPIYLKAGQEIIIGFLDDKAIFINFNKLKPGVKVSDLPVDIEETAPLSEAELNVLLQANAGTFKWTRQPGKEEPDREWSLSDGESHATYADRCLSIENKLGCEKWVAGLNLKRDAAIPSLGDSKADVDKRCGKPVETSDDGDVTYVKGSFKIVVSFWNDKVGRMSFQSSELEKDILNPGKRRPAALFGDEIKAVLKASAANSKWIESENTEDFWNRADKKAHAIYDLDSYTLVVIDEGFYQHLEANEKKDSEVKLKDLGVLGMTKAECDKQLGKHIGTLPDGELAYHKAGFAIMVTFWKDKAAKIIFLKIDAQNPDAVAENPSIILEAELKALLNANSNDSKWIEGRKYADGRTTSLRRDKLAFATHDSETRTLTISTIAYIAQIDEEDGNDDDKESTDDNEDKALKGF